MRFLINNSIFCRVLVIALALFPSIVFAHEETDSTGFLSGLTHPIFGIDHLLAMISVGIVSAQLGGKNIWRIPCALFNRRRKKEINWHKRFIIHRRIWHARAP